MLEGKERLSSKGVSHVQTAAPRNTTEVRLTLLAWSDDHRRQFPWREKTASDYEVLVAEVLLKRTTARAAARVFPAFIWQFPDVESVRRAGVEEIEKILEPVGLYRQRAKGFKELAEYLAVEHSGKVPGALPDLLKVPHLGPYSARAIMSFGHGMPAAIVDSNVQRVLGRLYRRRLGDAPSVADTQALADLVLDREHHQAFNWALLDLGATICRYDVPRCSSCPLAGPCDFTSRQRDFNQT